MQECHTICYRYDPGGHWVLKSRINREVENIKRMESAAQTGYIKGRLLDSGLTLAFGSLLMRSIGNKDSLEIGARMAGAVWSKEVPFGNILISIGKGGIPENIKIVPVSRLARESNRSLSEVEASLRYDGVSFDWKGN